ncbi:protein ECT2 isoform X1 [Bactrocera tryoni]|uniref:protein ECT2 isoform X1 n=1 Tax=Bactrocera tryoni TaxID=59916 RepID=UPI001A9858D3|nr:protein ECT2 isoform X1 [Bactrocera tryoni]
MDAMETIDEQSKSEMSISPSPSPENLRICLVGDVVNDTETVEAARCFNVPVITSENGLDVLNDYEWRTFFVLKDFEGPIYDAIHRNKQCILGPPALKHAAESKDGLIRNARPVYNYSMRGVVTCFTGIRKKDELTRLVNLIHSMGGCIRKDMNSKITHLICSHSGGDKYQYAKTFRLTVVRPAWVYAAWERRDELQFRATTDDFSREHKLKAFEGQKICFFGFPADEHQHMVDVLLSNGGVPAELDDPECSHVVMPNTGGYFLETMTNTCNSPKPQPILTNPQSHPQPSTPKRLYKTETVETTSTKKSTEANSEAAALVVTMPPSVAIDKTEGKSVNEKEPEKRIATANADRQMDVDDACSTEQLVDTPEAEDFVDPDNNVDDGNDDDDDGDYFDERLVVDYDRNKALQHGSPLPEGVDIDDPEDAMPVGQQNASTPQKPPAPTALATPSKYDINANSSGAELETENVKSLTSDDLNENASTPIKTTNVTAVDNADPNKSTTDGIILTKETFHNPNNISPILNAMPEATVTAAKPTSTLQIPNLIVTANSSPENEPSPMEVEAEAYDMNADVEEEDFGGLNELKRKRESFDSISLMSVESFALPNSTKKPKLLRTGSITRSIRRSMSFVAVRTPISKMLRPRRSSVALDGAPNDEDGCNADDSFCSIASIESTFNESIRKPVKEKFRSLRNRITRSSSKKDKHNLHAQPITPEKDEKYEREMPNSGFKTPKAPAKFLSAAAKAIGTPKSFAKHALLSAPLPSTSTLASNKLASAGLECSKSPIAAAVVPPSVDTPTAATYITPATLSLPHSPPPMLNSKLIANQEIIQQNTQLHTPAQAQTLENVQCKRELMQSAAVGRSLMVVDEHTTQAKPELKNHRTHILKSDWFWYTIQNGYADEMDYLFGDYLDSIANTPNTDRRDSLPISFNKRKRKRFSQRIQFEGTPIGSGKRRSSVSDAGLLSVSGSFFDCTTSPDKLEPGKLHNEVHIETPTVCESTPAKKSMRFNHFMDFFSTESNYVGILDTIVKLFKNPLEEIAETNDALLNKSEIKSIFNNFLPIHEVHQCMLESLRAIQGKWSEDCLIGDIILQHRDELTKAYPPYVNFFEQMKETLQQCDSQNPRFHAFLKINQTKPECGRQSLQDLMIRPVQRLPSISLLLNDILKHTNKNNPDYVKLEQALKAIKEVMMHINEDKRKTESRMAIFDIFNDIEGCPAHLVSSNRSFISKCEVTELSDNLSGRGDTLMLYLFSDTIEVCKKRSRAFNTAKSPSSTKSHKHVKLVSLNAIRFVIDITDSPRAFALLCRQDKEKLFSFTITDDETDKVVYLKLLCKQMAENACRTDTVSALLSRTSQELEVDISDVNLSTLSKAFKLAARTRQKVGRAFSFNKTPSKLKRAVSTMMTPPFGSTNSLTPASQLAQMRLASCANIHEAVDEEGNRSSSPSAQSEILLPPLSVQPMRKNKSSTMGVVGRL